MNKEEVLDWIDNTNSIDSLIEISQAVHNRAALIGENAKEELSVGDWVKIQFRDSERVGKVDKVNRTTVTVARTTDGHVFFNPIKLKPYFLTKLSDSEAQKMLKVFSD